MIYIPGTQQIDPSTTVGEDGAKYKVNARGIILSSETPEVFPTTGDGIEGAEDNYYFLPGTILFVVNSSETYIMNEESEFIKQ